MSKRLQALLKPFLSIKNPSGKSTGKSSNKDKPILSINKNPSGKSTGKSSNKDVVVFRNDLKPTVSIISRDTVDQLKSRLKDIEHEMNDMMNNEDTLYDLLNKEKMDLLNKEKMNLKKRIENYSNFDRIVGGINRRTARRRKSLRYGKRKSRRHRKL
jgi:hypothetical protein